MFHPFVGKHVVIEAVNNRINDSATADKLEYISHGEPDNPFIVRYANRISALRILQTILN
jgi:hypothetical protein